MNAHKTFKENPENSPANVWEEVVGKFPEFTGESKRGLLSKFITLLGNEKEEWGGVKAIRVCMKEYFSKWKKDKPSKADDFEEFLFSPDRHVIVIQVPPDRPSTSKAVTRGAVAPPANPKPSKGEDRPSTSKTVHPGVVDPPENPKMSKGANNPSTSKASVPPSIPKIVKVKIYMGTGWEKDFPKLVVRSSSLPNLFVNLRIHGGESQRTKVQRQTMTPCWGEDFVFRLSSPKDTELIAEVYDCSKLLETKFAGKFRLWVSELKPGIQVIPLTSEVGEPCRSAWLLVRFMLD